MTEQIANRSGQKLPFRTANRFQQKNPSFMHGKGYFAGGVDTFRGVYLARHATPWPKFSGELRGPGLAPPPSKTVSECRGNPLKVATYIFPWAKGQHFLGDSYITGPPSY
ncbi:MAG: hypothetical protein ACK56F_32325, partial [bacterium]